MSDNEGTKEVAAWSIGQFGERASTAVRALIKMLDASGPVREKAAEALGLIGNAAKYAVPRLEKMVEEDDYGDCKEIAQKALRKILKK